MTPHDLEEGVPRQGALELEQRVVVIDMDRDSFAVCACLWADARRGMPVCFHEVLLREDSCAYPWAYQKAQRTFNPTPTPPPTQPRNPPHPHPPHSQTPPHHLPPRLTTHNQPPHHAYNAAAST